MLFSIILNLHRLNEEFRILHFWVSLFCSIIILLAHNTATKWWLWWILSSIFSFLILFFFYFFPFCFYYYYMKYFTTNGRVKIWFIEIISKVHTINFRALHLNNQNICNFKIYTLSFLQKYLPLWFSYSKLNLLFAKFIERHAKFCTFEIRVIRQVL